MMREQFAHRLECPPEEVEERAMRHKPYQKIGTWELLQ